MFKAKLIKDDRYYRLRQSGKHILVGSLFIGFIVNFDRYPLWMTIILTVGFLVYETFIFRRMKKFNAITDESILELSGDELRIVSPDKEVSKIFDITTLDGIAFLERYRIPEDSWRSMIDEYQGKYQKNYLIVEQDNKPQRYDFELNSYYMITQLEKFITDWTVKGYPVKRIDP